MTTRQAHHQALAQAVTSYRDARSALEISRAELSQRIRAAAQDGMRQAEILWAMDHQWTREYVRRITRGEDAA